MRPSVLIPVLVALPFLASGCGKKRSPVEPPPAVQYDLQVRWLGAPPQASTQAAFSKAVARIKSIVVGGLTPVIVPGGFNVAECDSTLSGHADLAEETVAGLVIYASIESIDGQGGVLGSAGPCLVRDQNRFKPALGIMRLDAADLAAFATQDRLDALILHEMLHVIGFGTIWTDNTLLSGDGTDDARFTGTRARLACATVHGGATACATSVPVHSLDGPGSAYAHWRESVFTNELMTPFLNSGLVPLSEMSIRSLADIGYVVDIDAAEDYRLQAALVAAREPGAASVAEPPLALPAPQRPKFTVSDDGRILPIRHTRSIE
ncbi:MAG TPA: leishmanolysin-related zinc metalloendopeptidase [Gemmatimonadaceae bacterium]|nr:leishmanolysin-related zinc metalloendopeptidase [Gemmatimonadaceae bacterium]